MRRNFTLAAAVAGVSLALAPSSAWATNKRVDRAVAESLCVIHGHHWQVTCQQNRVAAAQWTCFVFDTHIHKCSPAEARMVLRGKYRVRIYRAR